ncbi:MAG: hypothetical protein IH600_04785 [Bacteroidetes bacterium]|nr:hypothetical protein [Bacteroidota bacterium]
MPAGVQATTLGKGVRWDALFLLLLTAAALVLFLFPLFSASLEAGFPLDDGWIHATYARGLVEHGEFAFNPGEPSTGTTSLLWTLLCAGVLLTGSSAAGTALFLGAACLLILVPVWHRVLLRTGCGRAGALFGAALLPLSGVLLWWSLSGMETVLFLLLAALALDAFMRGKLVWSGSWLALLVLARPEGVLLAPVLAFAEWRRSGSIGRTLLLLALAATGVAIYAAWNLAVSGALWTSTLAGRRWLAAGGRPPETGIQQFALAFAEILYRWMRTLLWGALRWSTPGTWISAAAAGMVLLWSGGRRIFHLLKPRRKADTPSASESGTAPSPTGTTPIRPVFAPALAAWLFLHTAAYALLLPYPGHAGRYLAPLLLGVSLLLARLASSLPRADGDLRIFPFLLRGILPRALLLAAVTVIGWSALASWTCAWRSSVEHINTVHVRAARWISKHTPPDARIAAYDIGAIGYFSGRTVIDLGGLVQPAAVPYMNGQIDAYILRSRADYVVMVIPYEGQDAEGYLPRALGYGQSGLLTLRRAAAFGIPEKAYQRHISITGNAYPRIVIETAHKKLEKS